jgi:hypothetical protein
VRSDVDADLDRQLKSPLAHHSQVLIGEVRGLAAGPNPLELIDQALQLLKASQLTLSVDQSAPRRSGD